MRYGLIFLILFALVLGYSWALYPYGLLLLWLALDFLLVGVAYLANSPRIFAKRDDGSRAAWSIVLLCPAFCATWLIWSLTRHLSKETAFHQLTEDLFIGRRLVDSEPRPPVEVVVDLCCELPESRPLAQLDYRTLRILDAAAPAPQALVALIEVLCTERRPIYVHCAQGHGRTGLIASALLIGRGLAADPEDAVAKVRAARPGVRLGRAQRGALERFAALWNGRS